MKAKIINHHLQRMENGKSKGYGDIVDITKKELMTGNYAPLKINVKPKKANKVEAVSKEDVQQEDNLADGGDAE
jgi:hypothetical protein